MLNLHVSLRLGALALVFALAGCAARSGTFTPALPGSEAEGASRMHPDSAPATIKITKLNPFPLDIATDEAGHEWAAAENPPEFVSIDEASHTKTTFALPYSNSFPTSVALGRHQNGMWSTDQVRNGLIYIAFATHKIHYYSVPTHNALINDITAGADNAMRFTEEYGGNIGRIELAHFTISEYSVPNHYQPFFITLASDGSLWFTLFRSNAIGRIDAGTHQITTYTLPHAHSAPWAITSGPDGAIWFTELVEPMAGARHKLRRDDVFHARIGRIDPNTHTIPEWPLSEANTYPLGIVSRGSSLWFTEEQGYIGKIDATSHAIHEYATPNGWQPREISLGTDDQLWFIYNSDVGKVCPDRSAQQCSTGS